MKSARVDIQRLTEDLGIGVSDDEPPDAPDPQPHPTAITDEPAAGMTAESGDEPATSGPDRPPDAPPDPPPYLPPWERALPGAIPRGGTGW